MPEEELQIPEGGYASLRSIRKPKPGIVEVLLGIAAGFLLLSLIFTQWELLSFYGRILFIKTGG
jgi:hypothetical protein